MNAFQDRGPEAVSLREIARAAEVSVSVVHHYYGSREALHTACLSVLYSQWELQAAEIFRELAKPTTDYRAAFESCVRLGYEFGRKHHMLMKLELRQLLETGEVEEQWRHANVEFMNRVAEALAPASELSLAQRRFAARNILFLTTRYAIATDLEVVDLFGEDPETCREMIVKHLAEFAARAFQLKAMP